MKNRKKRIALISEHASPLACIGMVDSGGQNIYVAQVARQLVKKGYKVDVFTRRDDPLIAEIVKWQPYIRVIHVKAGPQTNVIKEEMLQYMPEFQHNMVQFVVENKLHYELIHANFFMSGLVAAGLKKDLGIPYVITFHALGHVRRIYQAENDNFPAERIAIEEAIVQDADQIIAECPQDKYDLINYYNARPQKIDIVPCGFSPTEFYPIDKTAARKILKLPADSVILLQLGRMVRRKGIDNVIRSLAYLKSAGKPVKLVIAGGDSENMEESASDEYKRLCHIARRMGVTDMVEFAGRKDRSQLKFYYAAADLFITTPWYEPFGITPLEAMACGTPVIGANVGGIKFSVKDGITGAHVPPKQPKTLALKIKEMLGDESTLARIGQNAIKHVNTYFTWEKVADQLTEVYHKAIQGSGSVNRQNDSQAA
jgi:D-inositol-3-phosphate glycosyltransferase